jgi:hypothetical protein
MITPSAEEEKHLAQRMKWWPVFLIREQRRLQGIAERVQGDQTAATAPPVQPPPFVEEPATTQHPPFLISWDNNTAAEIQAAAPQEEPEPELPSASALPPSPYALLKTLESSQEQESETPEAPDETPTIAEPPPDSEDTRPLAQRNIKLGDAHRRTSEAG